MLRERRKKRASARGALPVPSCCLPLPEHSPCLSPDAACPCLSPAPARPLPLPARPAAGLGPAGAGATFRWCCCLCFFSDLYVTSYFRLTFGPWISFIRPCDHPPTASLSICLAMAQKVLFAVLPPRCHRWDLYIQLSYIFIHCFSPKPILRQVRRGCEGGGKKKIKKKKKKSFPKAEGEEGRRRGGGGGVVQHTSHQAVLTTITKVFN